MKIEQAYAILGVEPGAPPKEVQRAYRRQALKYHPDRGGTEDEAAYLTRKFMEVRDAYEFLRGQGFPVPEAEVVLEDVMPGGWTAFAGRSFKPKDPDEAKAFARQTDSEVKLGPGAVLLWGLVIPGGAVAVVWFVRWLFLR